MATTQKFLDEKGVQHLWSKISMEDYPNNETLIAVLNAIDQTKANKEEIPSKNSQLENDSKFISEDQVKSLFKSLNSDRTLRFYCIEDVTVIVNGVSTTYPANSNVEIKFIETDTFEIVPTSDNSILVLNGFPGALGTYYSWLEGVKQFSNILFDMNNVDFYSKWSQGNQSVYKVQYAQYLNCIFWSDNPYVSDVNKRTNYTLYNTSQLPLCYSSIPDNTFKSFFLAFGVNSDPNWGNPVYRESFAKATWATQAFSYYGARTIGIFGHDDPDFNITLPKDCRGLMYASTAVENAGTFDAINVTNFGAKSGSWRDAFGWCTSLRNLYIKNLKVNLNVSWSPLEYDSISFIIEMAANTNKITISLSPYTYYLLKDSDFELAASKNITIELLTTNYQEDKRLNEISNKADKTYVDNKITELVNSAPETLDTLGELAAAFSDNNEIVTILNEAITVKADKTYVDELIANIPTESDVFIVECPDGTTLSHTFEQIMDAVNNSKAVYVSLYGSVFMPLTYIAEDESFVEFHSVGLELNEDQFSLAWVEGLKVNSDNTFTMKYDDLLSRRNIEIEGPEGEKDIIRVINYLVEKSENTATNLLNGTAEGSLRGVNTLTESDSYTMGINAFAIGNGTKASGKNSFASGQDVEATGSYAHAEGYGTFATAAAAHAEGYDTHATARYAHAEGASTTASGNNSHAEGNSTTSSGHYSHAEGNFTTAAGAYSHAEGNYTQTTDGGTYSHVEGSYTKATKTGAHAEGNYAEANGTFSHVEGYYTKADSAYQHVRGKFNIVDDNGIYSTIVGNGDADSNRKNIHTLDWQGNSWFQGDVYTGSTSGTNKDEGSKKLATEEYVDNKSIDPVIIENKKNKDLIVTYAEDSTFGVTHSTEEIYEAVQNGTTIYFRKDTELLNLMEITPDYATFFMFYVNMEGKPQQKVVVIGDSNIMLEQDDIYDYATTTQLNNYYNKTEVDNLLSSVGSSDDVLSEYDAIILKSSTSGSTKKFKLTIDDDGILSAEEVIE